MCKRVAAFWLCAILLFGILISLDAVVNFTVHASGDTLYVNENGSVGFSSIQDAIDNASSGDTVFVYNGTYNGNIVIDKTINLTGESRDNSIINGEGSGIVVNITADWVNMSSFTIAGIGSGPEDKAIELNDAKNCNISNINISKNYLSTPIITINHITFSDTLVFSIFVGNTITYYNNTPSNNFTNSYVIYSPNNVAYNFTLSYNGTLLDNGTFDIGLKDYYYVTPIYNLTTPNNILINYTVVNWTVVELPVMEPFLVDPYVINIINISSWNFSVDPIVYTINYSLINYPVTFGYVIIPSHPPPPKNLTAKGEESRVYLSWECPSSYFGPPITNYRIYRGSDPEVVIRFIDIGNLTYYIDSNVENGVAYQYWVCAENIYGEGEPSEGVSATPKKPMSNKGIFIYIFFGVIWEFWIIRIAVIILFLTCLMIYLSSHTKKVISNLLLNH